MSVPAFTWTHDPNYCTQKNYREENLNSGNYDS